ncbi:aquaporin, partial [Hoylesella nanceiensis]
MKKYLAEMIGTMVLVLMGCGTAVSLGCNPVGADLSTVVGTAMAFGLSVIAMAYTIGGISGCHINPAITLGVFLSKRMSGKDALMYIVFQVIGGLLGAAILYALVTSAGTDFALAGAGLGSNDLQSGVSVAG